MKLDQGALAAASRAFGQWLQAEAETQQAYVFRFPDGRLSLELEWLDVAAATEAIVAAYLARCPDGAAPATRDRTPGSAPA